MLNPDFRDILSAFCDEKVDFLLVGAYALAVHGLPRATGDIDLWVRRSGENARRIRKALVRFGATPTVPSGNEFETPDTVVQIGVAPRRIDILTSIDGVDFDAAWPNRTVVVVEGLEIPVIGKKELVENKKAVGRPQDLADVSRLESEAG